MSDDVARYGGTLHAEIVALVGKYGIKNVRTMVDVVRDDLGAVETPKRMKHAAVYKGRLLRNTGKAVLWWIPPAKGAIHGQAAWIPQVLVVSAIDNCPANPLELPLGVLTTTKPVAWEYCRLIGSSVEWLGERRRRSA